MTQSSRHIAIEIVRKLQAAGFAAFWVGGCVRDLKLGREPQDYDIATSARPDQIETLFAHTIPVGRQFGIIVVVVDGRQFQVATFRSDFGYADGRHPDQVQFGDPQADALRRDFTINGLFYDPVQERLHDWVGGAQDFNQRLIRAIGDPSKRFAEDHLRLLRAVRFAAQLDFDIETQTLRALQANASKITRVSAERIREELLKLFCPPYAARGLDLLRDSHLLKEILPELAATIGCLQSPDYHPEGDVYNHIRLMLRHLPDEACPTLVWAVLLHDIAKPVTASADVNSGAIHFYSHDKIGAAMAAAIMERLRFPRKECEAVSACVLHHMQFMHVPQMRKATLRRLLMRPTFAVELELHRLDCLGSHQQLDIYELLKGQAEMLLQQPQIRPPLLTGDDLIVLGIKPGPYMGELLAEIRERQLQDELTTPAQARAWVRERMRDSH